MIIKVPYRINWAGAYLDCIEEPVITSVINKYITAESQAIPENFILVYSKELNLTYKAFLRPAIKSNNYNSWTDYVDGCIAVFARNDLRLTNGCQIIIDNDLPSGIGVSSSAAFIIAIIKTLCYWNNIDLDDSIVASFGYWVEHDYLQIPCGRMDFKAVLHKPGIWKINTNTDNLYQDKKLGNLASTGLLIYKDHYSHTHVTDGKFLENVSKIRNTKFNYDIDDKTAVYIGLEESIVNVLNYLGSDDKLTEEYLGQFLNQSCLNIKSWLNIDTSDIRLDGVYGEKIVGSGLRGAHFLLINKEKEFEIRQALGEKYNIIEVEL